MKILLIPRLFELFPIMLVEELFGKKMFVCVCVGGLP